MNYWMLKLKSMINIMQQSNFQQRSRKQLQIDIQNTIPNLLVPKSDLNALIGLCSTNSFISNVQNKTTNHIINHILNQIIILFYIFPMLKQKINQQTNTNNTITHQPPTFQLRPTTHTHSFNRILKIQLSQKQKTPSNKTQKQRNLNPQYPIWNNDNLSFTPAFILPQDKRIFDILKNSLSPDEFKQNDQIHSQTTNQLQTTLAPPHPLKQSHCGVCRESYQNFQVHVNSLKHKENCRQSAYTKYIFQLCQEIHSQLLYTKIEKQRNKPEAHQNISNELLVKKGLSSSKTFSKVTFMQMNTIQSDVFDGKSRQEQTLCEVNQSKSVQPL